MIPAGQGATTVIGALSAQAKAAAASFTAAAATATAFQRALGVIGIALAVVAAAWVAVDSVTTGLENAKKEAEEFAAANFEAAGGIEAFVKASESGTANGAKLYGELTMSVEKMTDKQIEERKAVLAAAVARTELTKDTEAGKVAYDKAIAAQDKFNESVLEGQGNLEQSTIALTEDTKAVYANALAKITVAGKDETLNLYEYIGEMPKSVEDRLTKAGTSYAKILNDSIEAAMTGDMTASEYMTKELMRIEQTDLLGAAFDVNHSEFINNTMAAVGTIDSITESARKSGLEVDIMGSIFGVTGDAAEDLEGEGIDLNEVLRTTISLLSAPELAENKAADALDTFAQAALETGGEVEGLGLAARENLSNFVSFMDSAVEASIAAGEGTPGAIRRMLEALNSLEAAGVNTSQVFKLVRDAIVNSVAGMTFADSTLKQQLAVAPNLSSMRSIINAFYAAKMAAKGWSSDIRIEWERVLSMLSAGSGPTINFNPNVSTGTVKTALEKLQEMIEKAFRSLNIDLSVRDSLAAFGQAIAENGNTFSRTTEAGRSNIEALQDVIDNLAVRSGGDLQKFANDLASLRLALVEAGVPSSGLKIIDTALSAIGRTGTASRSTVDSFANSMEQLAETKTGILALKEVVESLASSVKNSLNAAFAGIDATDNVTLGWIEMADAAEEAQKQIDNATRAIADANAEIGELTADRGKLEYQLQIAIKYGDSIRANEIRAQIDSINSSIAEQSSTIAENNEEIAKANSALGRGGDGQDPKELIERNRALREMAGRYADLATWQLVTAEEGANLKDVIEEQVESFTNNALQMGYTAEEAKQVAMLLAGGLMRAMNDIPSDIGVVIDADTDRALEQVRTFSEQATDILNQIPSRLMLEWELVQSASNGIFGLPSASDSILNGASIGMASGGLVQGSGGPTQDNIPAMLSSGEYVVKAAAVSAYGLDFMNALNQQRIAPSRSMAVGAAGGSGSQLVYLSPEDRQLLRAAIDRPIALYTDNATIAKSANAGNALLAQRGLN
jgi:hypothetical protein